MPNTKVTNLAGGLFRSRTPEQIPEISWYDLINFDILDDALVTRVGSTASNSNGLQSGCLQSGFSSTLTNAGLDVRRTGDYGIASTTDTKWTMSIYAKPLASPGTLQPIIQFTDNTAAPASPQSLFRLQWSAGTTLQCAFRQTNAASFTTFNTSVTISSGTTHMYGVVMTPVSTTIMKFQVFDHSGVVGTTNHTNSGSWAKYTGIITTSSYMRYGGLCITRNESLSTTVTDSFNVLAPGNACATANRIAYYPFTKDYADAWGNNPTFPSDRWFQTGGGLVQYQVDDDKLTSPQLTSILHSTKSLKYNKNDEQLARSGATSGVSTTFAGYFNGVSKGYTVTFPLLVEKFPSTSTTFTLWDTSSNAGFKIDMSYNSASDVKMTYTHALNTTVSTAITSLVPLHKKSVLMFDYNATATTMTQKIFRDFGQVATTTKTVSGGTGLKPTQLRLLNGSSTTGANFYISSILLHNVSVGTTWSRRPQANIGRVTETRKVMEAVGSSIAVDPLTGEDYDTGKIRYTGVETTSTVTTFKDDGEQTDRFNQYLIPSFSSVVGMYLFNEESGYDYAGLTDKSGRWINYADQGNTHNSDLVASSVDLPFWVADRKASGLTATGFLGDEYHDEFDSAFSYVPAKPALTDRIMLSSNMNLTDENKNTYVLSTTFAIGRKGVGPAGGFMYGNDLFYFSKHGFFKFDGTSVHNLEVPSPNIRLVATKTSGSSGMNGAFAYTYTFKNRVGIESQPALPSSVTVATGSVALALNLRLSNASMIDDTVASVELYRTKGSVGSATTLVLNNGTFFYKVSSFPLETVRDMAGSTLFTDTLADSALGAEMNSNVSDVVPRCKYGVIYQDSGVYTGNESMPNHYFVSQPFAPERLESFGEFRTEEGNPNTAIFGLPAGFLVFKRDSRQLVRLGSGGGIREFRDGGCMSDASLAPVGDGVIGLGDNGFFYSEGNNYRDITGSNADGRKVSSIQMDVDGWSDAVKQAAQAVYHDATYRYICYVNDKFYIYHTKRRVWRKYEDFVGMPIIYKGEFYIYKKGWLWKEADTQAYVGTGSFIDDVTGGGVGYVNVVSTTTLPTTIGLPIYIDNTYTNVRKITNSGTTYKISVNSNVNFSSASKIYMGTIEPEAETKGWAERTDHRIKWFKWLRLNHGGASDGSINVRYVRRGETMDDSYNHYVIDTDKQESRCKLDVKSEDIRIKFNIKDGKKHTLKSYQLDFEQGEYGI